MIVEVSNLSKKFRNKEKEKKDLVSYGFPHRFFKRISKREYKSAVDNISFEIKRGEIFGLLGPNGAGKTTVTKILSGLMEPDKGKVKLFGEPIPENMPKIRHRFNGVFARANLFWQLTGRDNLDLYANIYDIDNKDEKIKKYLRFFELENKTDTYMDRYSTGEIMRFNLAKALLNDPEFLFMDEPSIGLDPRMSLKVRKFLKELNRKENVSMLITTHYMEEADYLCDRIAIIDEGKIIKIDTPENLKSIMSKEDVLEVRVGNIDSDTIENLNSMKEVDRARFISEEGKIRIVLKHLNHSDKVLKYLKNNNLKIISINTDEPTLGDVFIHLTGRELRGKL